MKKSLLAILLVPSVLISAIGGSLLTRSPIAQWQSQPLLAQENKKYLHHIVLFDLKDNISNRDKAKIVTSGKTLLSKIPFAYGDSNGF